MQILNKCRNIFIDFDGVVVDSNKFKEKAIEKSIFKIAGKNQKSIKAINYFNLNAGISRHKKLSLFFNSDDTSSIMKIYSKECINFFSSKTPTMGLNEFLSCIKKNNNLIKIYIKSRKSLRVFLQWGVLVCLKKFQCF